MPSGRNTAAAFVYDWSGPFAYIWTVRVLHTLTILLFFVVRPFFDVAAAMLIHKRC